MNAGPTVDTHVPSEVERNSSKPVLAFRVRNCCKTVYTNIPRICLGLLQKLEMGLELAIPSWKS